MVCVTLGSSGTGLVLMYSAHYNSQGENLAELVRQQTATWNAVARYDTAHDRTMADGGFEATLAQMRRAHSRLTGFGESGELIVARARGDSLEFLVPLRHAPGVQSVHLEGTHSEPMRRALRGEQGLTELLDYRGETVLAAYAPVEGLGVGMVAKLDLQEIRASFLSAALTVVGVTLVLILLGILVFLRVTGPVLRRMHRQRRFMRTLITNLPGVAYRCRLDPDWPMEFISDGILRLAGYPANEILNGNIMYGRDLIHPDDRERVFVAIQTALEEGRGFELRYRIYTKDRQLRWVWERGCGVDAAAGELRALEGFICDITPLKEAEDARERLTTELENRVAQRTEELQEANLLLEVSNSELEQFAYVASHDLRAPLRAIDNLSQWIAEDLGSDLDGEVAENLGLMRGRVQRMSAMLDSLLQYSRVGRKETSVETVDVAKLLRELIELNPPPDGISVEVGAGMPTLTTQGVPLRHVFTNLIANAIRHHDREQGCIRVEAQKRDTCWEFSVSDDGPGIPERFQERVFQLFQTLKARDSGGGTGMGLALVKKYVEAVGGELRLQSEGRGCCFIFSWPESEQTSAQPAV